MLLLFVSCGLLRVSVSGDFKVICIALGGIFSKLLNI